MNLYNCENCIHWMKYSNKEILGQCRKYAPELLLAPAGSFIWFRPVKEFGWPETKKTIGVMRLRKRNRIG